MSEPFTPHITILKEARNFTKNTGWSTVEVDAELNDIIQWRITYLSDGDYVAENVVISDTLPANAPIPIELGSFSSDCSTCTEATFFTTGCNIGDLPVATSCQVTFQTDVTACDIVTINTADVSNSVRHS